MKVVDFFTTGSCADYHFKPLHRLLQLYTKQSTGQDVDLQNRSTLFTALQQNSHIVGHYFQLRTEDYFEKVMGPVFGVNAYWYRQEFAKSRGMIHWHGLCWRSAQGLLIDVGHPALSSTNIPPLYRKGIYQLR